MEMASGGGKTGKGRSGFKESYSVGRERIAKKRGLLSKATEFNPGREASWGLGRRGGREETELKIHLRLIRALLQEPEETEREFKRRRAWSESYREQKEKKN